MLLLAVCLYTQIIVRIINSSSSGIDNNTTNIYPANLDSIGRRLDGFVYDVINDRYYIL